MTPSGKEDQAQAPLRSAQDERRGEGSLSLHTPGPWGVEYTDEAIWVGPMRSDGVKVRDIVVGVEFGTEYTETFKARARANARLISAAPDLLEACKSAFEAL